MPKDTPVLRQRDSSPQPAAPALRPLRQGPSCQGPSHRIPCRRVSRLIRPFPRPHSIPQPQPCPSSAIAAVHLFRTTRNVLVTNFHAQFPTSRSPSGPLLAPLSPIPNQTAIASDLPETTDAYDTSCISPCPRGKRRDRRPMPPATRVEALRFRLRSRISFAAGQDG